MPAVVIQDVPLGEFIAKSRSSVLNAVPIDTITPAAPSVIISAPLTSLPSYFSSHISSRTSLSLSSLLSLTSSSTYQTAPLVAREPRISNNAVNVPARMSSLNKPIDVSAILNNTQKVSVQAVALALAALTLVSVLVSLYWFVLMKKKFRHKLILLLIVANFTRAIWLFLFPLVSLARSTSIPSESGFCQASGFFTQVGTEMADFATLIIAIHTAMQILRPDITSQGVKETGLSRYSYIVFPTVILLPIVLAALPFIRSSSTGYLSQGAFCSLPLRPFWYRLATAWVPRYFILFTIIALYIAIYIHVWRHFKRSPELQNDNRDGSYNSSHTESRTTDNSTLDGTAPDVISIRAKRQSGINRNQRSTIQNHGHELGHTSGPIEWKQVFDETRRESDRTTLVDESSPMRLFADGQVSNRSSINRHSAAFSDLTAVGDGSVSFSATTIPPRPSYPVRTSYPPLRPILYDESVGTPDSEMPPQRIMKPNVRHDPQRNNIRKRYKAIKRQLNLLFVYPTCYFFIWLIPLSFNICNYNQHLVQHPVFVLLLLSYACIAGMGFVDCLIFTIREKPWLHIPGSDGTFFGSFQFWKMSRDERENPYLAQMKALPPAARKGSIIPMFPVLGRRRSSFDTNYSRQLKDMEAGTNASPTSGQYPRKDSRGGAFPGGLSGQLNRVLSDVPEGDTIDYPPIIKEEAANEEHDHLALTSTTEKEMGGKINAPNDSSITDKVRDSQDQQSSDNDRVTAQGKPRERYWFERKLSLVLKKTRSASSTDELDGRDE